MLIAPADLVKLFGWPEIPELHTHVTGIFHFEDNNLDVFSMYDFKATQAYWGMNREDDYYDNDKNWRRPPHKRKLRRPTVEEFWASSEPFKFRIATDPHVDLIGFRRWMRKQLDSITPETKSFSEIHTPLYKDEVGISHGDYNEKAKFCHDVMAF